MLTWHVTFEDAPELHAHVAEYQRAVKHLPGLNLVPPEWLHLTVQGVGYADETPAENVTAVVRSVRAKLSEVRSFALTFARPIIFGEAIAIRPQPAEPLQQLLTVIRAGIADAVGPDAVPTGPEHARGFHPHLSIAYSNGDADAAPYRAALAMVDRQPVTATVSAVTLIRQNRELDPHWLYRWTTEATAALPS